MSEQLPESHKPWPEIPRFPGEPRLEGPPQSGKDSVFSYPGLIETADIVADIADVNSAERQRLVPMFVNGLTPRQLERVLASTSAITKEEIEADRNFTFASLVIRNTASKASGEAEPAFSTAIARDLAASEILEPTVSCIEALEKHRSPAKQRHLLADRSTSLMREPGLLIQEFENLDSIEQELNSRTDTDEIENYRTRAQDYRQKILAALESVPGRSVGELPSEEILGKLMGCYGEEKHELQKISATLLKGYIDKTTHPNEVIDAVHGMVSGALISGNRAAGREAIRLILGQSNLIRRGTRPFVDYGGGHVFTDEARYQKSCELDDSLGSIVLKDRKLFHSYFSRQEAAELVVAFHTEGGFGWDMEDPFTKARVDELNKLEVQEIGVETSQAKTANRQEHGYWGLRNTWQRIKPAKEVDGSSDSDHSTSTQLRAFINERSIAKHLDKKLPWSKKVKANIALPNFMSGIDSKLPEISKLVAEKVKTADASSPTINSPEGWRTLGLLVPANIDQRRINELTTYNTQLRQAITEDRLRGLSERGDSITVTDGLLSGLGFKAIYFKAQTGFKGMSVETRVGNLTFAARLTEDFELATVQSGDKIQLPGYSRFMEGVILAHLHELVCAPADQQSEEGSEWEKEFFSRRDHQRTLPLGHVPSQQQIIKAKFDYGVDLVKRNQQRIAAGEEQLVTWVKHTERIDRTTEGPVRSSSQKAGQRIQQIFK